MAYSCLYRFKDGNADLSEKIVGYRLLNLETGRNLSVWTDDPNGSNEIRNVAELKSGMACGSIQVNNLALDSAGRLRITDKSLNDSEEFVRRKKEADSLMQYLSSEADPMGIRKICSYVDNLTTFKLYAINYLRGEHFTISGVFSREDINPRFMSVRQVEFGIEPETGRFIALIDNESKKRRFLELNMNCMESIEIVKEYLLYGLDRAGKKYEGYASGKIQMDSSGINKVTGAVQKDNPQTRAKDLGYVRKQIEESKSVFGLFKAFARKDK